MLYTYRKIEGWMDIESCTNFLRERELSQKLYEYKVIDL